MRNVNEAESAATLGAVNGMGNASFPGDPGLQADFGSQVVGSGDDPNAKFNKKKRKKKFKSYREFIQDDNLEAST